MKVSPATNWETYSYHNDAGLVVVAFHADSNQIPQAEYPHCARVIISITAPNQNGGPARPEAEVLWAMEDALVAALEERSVKCLLLGRLTHSGRRELVFQVADWEDFRPPVGRWMGQQQDHEIDVSEHDGWKFFFDCVWPTDEQWHLILDRRVVENLKKSGSDPAKIHQLEFVFLGEVAPLRLLREQLVKSGYAPIDFNEDEKRLIATKGMALDVSMIANEGIRHEREARELGIAYDGWGCSVVN